MLTYCTSLYTLKYIQEYKDVYNIKIYYKELYDSDVLKKKHKN